MPNGKLRYFITVAGLVTSILLYALWDYGISRASDDDVKEVREAIQANAVRQEKHEREANEKFTKILVNQGSIATSIDFLVKKQDPQRQPIAPAVAASSETGSDTQ